MASTPDKGKNVSKLLQAELNLSHSMIFKSEPATENIS